MSWISTVKLGVAQQHFFLFYGRIFALATSVSSRQCAMNLNATSSAEKTRGWKSGNLSFKNSLIRWETEGFNSLATAGKLTSNNNNLVFKYFSLSTHSCHGLLWVMYTSITLGKNLKKKFCWVRVLCWLQIKLACWHHCATALLSYLLSTVFFNLF